MTTWVLLCTSSCIQSVGAIRTEGGGDGIIVIKFFFAILRTLANNDLQRTFDSIKRKIREIYLIASMLSQER